MPMNQKIQTRILWIWFAICSLHIVLVALACIELFIDTLLEGFGVTVVLVPYILHGLGLPVLLDDGLAGGGWASPNSFGWFLSVIAWLSLYLLIAIGIERLSRKINGKIKK